MNAARLSERPRPQVLCACSARLESADALADHREWCLGDARANARLHQEVRRRDGEITYEGLVAVARQQRRARPASGAVA